MNKKKVRITNTGYLPNSPDRHNSMNIIPSNRITMDRVPFPIMGIDNLGNSQMMMPGMNYRFPGQYVTEIPMGSYNPRKRYNDLRQKQNNLEQLRDNYLRKNIQNYDPTNFVKYNTPYEGTGLSLNESNELERLSTLGYLTPEEKSRSFDFKQGGKITKYQGDKEPSQVGTSEKKPRDRYHDIQLSSRAITCPEGYIANEKGKCELKYPYVTIQQFEHDFDLSKATDAEKDIYNRYNTAEKYWLDKGYIPYLTEKTYGVLGDYDTFDPPSAELLASGFNEYDWENVIMNPDSPNSLLAPSFGGIHYFGNWPDESIPKIRVDKNIPLQRQTMYVHPDIIDPKTGVVRGSYEPGDIIGKDKPGYCPGCIREANQIDPKEGYYITNDENSTDLGVGYLHHWYTDPSGKHVTEKKGSVLHRDYMSPDEFTNWRSNPSNDRYDVLFDPSKTIYKNPGDAYRVLQTERTNKYQSQAEARRKADYEKIQSLKKKKQGGIYLGNYEFKNGGLVKMQGDEGPSQFDTWMMQGLRPEKVVQDNTYISTPRLEEERRDDAKGLTLNQKKEKAAVSKKLRDAEIQKKKRELLLENEKQKKETDARISSMFGTTFNSDDYIKDESGHSRLATDREKAFRKQMLDEYLTDRAAYLIGKKYQPLSKDIEDFTDIAVPALAFELAPYALPYVWGAGKSAVGAIKNLKFPRSNRLPNSIKIADDIVPSSKWTTENIINEGLPGPPKEQYPLFGEPEYIDLTKHSADEIDNMIQQGYDQGITDYISGSYNGPSSSIVYDKSTFKPKFNLFKSKINYDFNGGNKGIRKKIINFLDPEENYGYTSEAKQAYQDFIQDFNNSRLTLGEKLPEGISDDTYKIWADQIYPNLGSVASPQELREAHAYAVNYFKNHPFVDEKAMGLVMRERLAPKIADFQLPQFKTSKGEPIMSMSPFTELQVSNQQQANTIREALKRKLIGSGKKGKSLEEVEKIIKNKKPSTEYDIQRLNKTLSDAGYTPEERNLINAYARGFDHSMNDVLRANHDLSTLPENTVNRFYLDKAEELKQAILKNKINSEDIPYVFRGVSNHDVELVDPETLQLTGKIIRKSDLQKGDHFIDRGFVSTSYGPDRSRWGTFDASEKIIIPQGKKLSGAAPNTLGHSFFPNEKEIVLPSGLIRRVDDIVEPLDITRDSKFVTSIMNPYKKGGLVRMQDGGSKEMPFGLPLKEQNVYLLPEYNQPINPFTGEILPDMRRPSLGMNTGATEYKYTYGTDKGDIDIPSIVAGQYIGDQALNRYNLTGERFKTMNDPGSYSKFYDEMNKLGLMQERNGGAIKKVKIKSLPRKNK